MKTITVPITSLHPNPWNPNKETPQVRQAVRESIEAFGFIVQPLVRPHPTIDGEYEIIDGEHRSDEARELGLLEVPVNVIDANDEQAKKLTLIMCETRGAVDPVDASYLLAEIHPFFGDDLGVGLPWMSAELDDMLKLASKEWVPPPAPSKGEKADQGEWVTFSCRVPSAAADLVRSAHTRYYNGARQPREDVSWGLLLEHLAADYMAGAGQ